MNRVTDELDDMPLTQRPRHAELRDDYRDEHMSSPEREFTLSTGTVLALFFGLALICAVFFGFGYSMGRKSAVPSGAVVASNPSTDNDGTAARDSNANKPSAASPAVQVIPSYQGQAASAYDATSGSKTTSAAAAETKSASVTLPVETSGGKTKKSSVASDPDGRIVEEPVTPAASVASTVAPVHGIAESASSGTVYVQVAAVSHKEDAEVLVGALKRRGYSVFTRGSDADKLIHVQLGPFATKKDADAMRQRLLGDGYNAIVK